MITPDDVLWYIKQNLSLPSNYLEKTDAELTDYINHETIPLFSKYFPDSFYVGIDPENKETRGTGALYNWFYIKDPEGLTIISPLNYYFSQDNEWVIGQPVFGPFTAMGDLKDWALRCFESNLLRPYSNWTYTVKFYPPNRIRVIGSVATKQGSSQNPQSPFVVEYERYHNPSLITIPAAQEREFKDLCLADAMIWIGRVRSMYGNGTLQTQFGEIPLHGQELMDQGRELKREVIEQLSESCVPGVIFDVG